MDTKRIYFNSRKILITVLGLLCFFVLYSYRVMKDINLQAFTFTTTVTEYNTYQKINVNDVDALAQNVKSVLKDRISIVAEPIILEQTQTSLLMQIDEYEIEAKLAKYETLKKTKIELFIRQQSGQLIEEIQMPVEFVDIEAPEIILSSNHIEIDEEEKFHAGDFIVAINDNYDQNLSYHVIQDIPEVDGKLVSGSYDVIYECYDRSNNKGTAVLNVIVKQKKMEPVIMDHMNTSLYNQAVKLIGKPYVWGGKGPDVFDCSGIIMYLYQFNHLGLQWNDIQYGTGTLISLDSAYWQVGDILSYVDSSGKIVHHALYLGNEQALHALTSGVDIITIDTPILAVDGSYQKLARVMRYTDYFK